MTELPIPDELLTPRQARSSLGDLIGRPVPVSTFGHWARKDTGLKTAKRTGGGHRRFRREAVVEFAARMLGVAEDALAGALA